MPTCIVGRVGWTVPTGCQLPAVRNRLNRRDTEGQRIDFSYTQCSSNLDAARQDAVSVANRSDWHLPCGRVARLSYLERVGSAVRTFQMSTHLKLSGIRRGRLLNLGAKGLRYRRMAFLRNPHESA